MNKVLYQSDHPVTLVGGGDAPARDIDDSLSLAPGLVAADGGARAALSAGHTPKAVIGDFDSIDPESRARIAPELQFKIAEQNSTDFDKALRSIAAPLVIGVGFLGARVDHQLAAFSTLLAHAHRPCLLLGANEIVFHAPPSIVLPTEPGDVVSLYPLVECEGRSTMLEWPIDGLNLSPAGQIGTSNRALGPATLAVATPGLLVIVPRMRLSSLVARMMLPNAPRWPVRAG
ncbi:MAG: thiamine diphosphokinase [Pseudomonadota bacterium]